MRFDEEALPNEIEGRVFDGAQPPGLGRVVLGIDQGVDGVLPGALAQIIVAGGEERLGHLQIERGLTHRLVSYQDELGSFVEVLRAKAFALASVGIDAVERAAPDSVLEKPESIFHMDLSVPESRSMELASSGRLHGSGFGAPTEHRDWCPFWCPLRVHAAISACRPSGRNWLRGLDLNQRPSGYEPEDCTTYKCYFACGQPSFPGSVTGPSVGAVSPEPFRAT